ncbi:hypothetical protein AM586_18815 [Massilia sp. WG5]|nr:hypothetical protein AM586_18815 [Massilia sp. WG5]
MCKHSVILIDYLQPALAICRSWQQLERTRCVGKNGGDVLARIANDERSWRMTRNAAANALVSGACAVHGLNAVIDSQYGVVQPTHFRMNNCTRQYASHRMRNQYDFIAFLSMILIGLD